MKKTAIYQRKRLDAPGWFNKWVQSPQWLLGFGIVAAVCLSVYAIGAVLGRQAPSSAWRTSYGVAATAVVLAVAFYGGRRRTQRIRSLGRTWYYLEVHVYGGALFVLLMLMHVSFRAPQGILTWWLWASSLWMMGSGLFGLALQKWIPTLLASGLSVEVHFDRIPELITEIRTRAEALLEQASEPVRGLYRRVVAPVMEGPQARWIYYVDATGGFRSQARHFEHIRGVLSESDRGRLDDILELYRTKLELDAHYTLQRAMHRWLYLHVPVAILILGLLALHIFFSMYY